MRNVLAALIAACVLGLSIRALAATETITGELVERSCYMTDPKSNVGEAHKGCAVSCARGGLPVALVTSDGKVYTVTGALAADNNAKLLPHIAHKVELTGEVTEANGRLTIEATDLKMAK